MISNRSLRIRWQAAMPFDPCHSARPPIFPQLGFALLLRLSRRFELGFGRSLRLCLQFSLGLANALSALLLVGDPIRHLLAGLVGAVPLSSSASVASAASSHLPTSASNSAARFSMRS